MRLLIAALGLASSAGTVSQEETYHNPTDKKDSVAPGGWQTYAPPGAAGPTQEKVTLEEVRLLQSEEEIASRTTADQLSRFMNLAHEAASEVFSSYEKPAQLLVQFTCTPEKCAPHIASQGEPPRELLQAYYDRLNHLQPPLVSGEVKFQFTLHVRPSAGPVQSKQETAPDSGGIVVPEGYVLQVLGATDGRIAMPKGWHYSNGATPGGWLWTFSAEDPTAGEYETGMRIQMFVKVEESLKRSRESFATGFLQGKRKASKVLREWPVTDFGSFKRQGIEVLEDLKEPSGIKRFHLIYSVMWLKNMDIVAVSTFGAPELKWESVADVSRVMSEFILIGQKPGNSN